MSGSIDGGATLYTDERVQPQLKALAEKLHWDTSLIKVAPREEEAAKRRAKYEERFADAA